MKVIIDEGGEIIAKETDDHTLVGGHHRLSQAASLGKKLFWRDRRTCEARSLLQALWKFASIYGLSRPQVCCSDYMLTGVGVVARLAEALAPMLSVLRRDAPTCTA